MWQLVPRRARDKCLLEGAPQKRHAGRVVGRATEDRANLKGIALKSLRLRIRCFFITRAIITIGKRSRKRVRVTAGLWPL